jgi:hypothetical protein
MHRGEVLRSSVVLDQAPPSQESSEPASTANLAEVAYAGHS